MIQQKKPGEGLIAKVRSKRVATVNNRKGSGEFTDYGVQRKGNPIKMTSERTKEGKNIFGRNVIKYRTVQPGEDGTFKVKKEKITFNDDQKRGITKIKAKTYDSTGKRIAIGKAKSISTKDGYNTKEKLKDKDGKSVEVRKGFGGKNYKLKKATGIFKR